MIALYRNYGTVLTVSLEGRSGYTRDVSASVGSIADDGKYTVTDNVTFTGTYTEDDDDDNTAILVAAVVIIIIILVALAYYFMKRKN